MSFIYTEYYQRQTYRKTKPFSIEHMENLYQSLNCAHLHYIIKHQGKSFKFTTSENKIRDFYLNYCL